MELELLGTVYYEILKANAAGYLNFYSHQVYWLEFKQWLAAIQKWNEVAIGLRKPVTCAFAYLENVVRLLITHFNARKQ